MKNFILIFVLLNSIILFGQQIPNSNLETWNDEGSFENPDQWATSNTSVMVATIETVSKDTSHVSGDYSARLESKSPMGFSSIAPGLLTLGEFNLDIVAQSGTVSGGIPWTQRTERFKGYYKYSPEGNDQAFIAMVMFKYNPTTGESDTIAEAHFCPNTEVTDWTEFDLELIWTSNETPDTMNIICMSSDGRYTPIEGSTLYIDNISIQGVVSDVKQINTKNTASNIFPNPSNGIINITKTDNIEKIEIFDMSGKSVYQTNLLPKNNQLDVSNLTQGMYFIRLYKTNTAIETQKLILN